MKNRTIVFIAVITLIVCCNSFADNTLSDANIQQIIKELTDNPRMTWIPEGTIEATQEVYRAPQTTDLDQIQSAISQSIEDYEDNADKPEKNEKLQKMALDAIPFNVRYKLSNEYEMKKSIFLNYDGQRFYCDITIDSREDSITLPPELEGNYMTEQFNLDWNGRNILCFDGEKTTIYSVPVNHVRVDATNSFPDGIFTTLTAGLIPWGYGYFTYENLSKIESSAVEKIVDGKPQIHLNLTNTDNSELKIILDPEKEYAVLSCIITDRDSVTIKTNSDYELVSGSWVPTTIVIEEYDLSNNLLAGDYINITNISGDIPISSSFVVDYNPNALIEYKYDVARRDLVYRYSNIANTELLLAERLAYIASEGKRLQNCATASLQYAALQLGKDILNQQLTTLVNPDDYTTNLYDMKEYAQNLGFNCKAVTTDIQTLKDLSGCKAILHIPGKNHFVLLDHIDEKYVWIIDLSEDKFYYRTDISFFDMDWTEGTALLISNQSIQLPDGATEIANAQLHDYIGGSGYQCDVLLQEEFYVYCAFDGMNCWGLYEIYFERWGCGAAQSGSCSEELDYRKVTFPCHDDPYNPYTCIIYFSEMKVYYIWACL